MNKLLQIISFQNCESCIGSEHGILYEIGKDFALPILISLAGALVVYYVFLSETRRDKQKELVRANQEREDRMLFFSSIVINSIKLSEIQKTHIKSYIRQMRLSQIEFNYMKIVPLDDLKRITEVLNLELFLVAYTNSFSKNRKEAVKEFQNIISCFDYLYDVFTMIKTELQKLQKSDYERKIEYKNHFKNCDYALGKIILFFERGGANDPYNKRLLEIYQSYQSNHPLHNYDIAYNHENFFLPLFDFITDFLNENRFFNEDLDKFYYNLKQGIQVYNHVIAENTMTRKSLIKDYTEISRTLIRLHKYAGQISKSYNS